MIEYSLFPSDSSIFTNIVFHNGKILAPELNAVDGQSVKVFCGNLEFIGYIAIRNLVISYILEDGEIIEVVDFTKNKHRGVCKNLDRCGVKVQLADF